MIRMPHKAGNYIVTVHKGASSLPLRFIAYYDGRSFDVYSDETVIRWTYV
jgi:hypothetical protein